MRTNKALSNFIFIVFSFIVITILSPILSIVLGILFASLYRDKANIISKKIASYPLQIGIVLLGLTITLDSLLPIVKDYFIWVSFFVIFSFIICYLIGRRLGLDNKLILLLSSGSAICGATAMALVSPLIKAKAETLMISLSIIFTLNTVAIILFPFFGTYLNMSDYEFGIFTALAIHDTGSVVGSALQFSDNSVEYAASLKILRTLWLIPLIIFLNFKFNTINSKKSFPIFILFFIVAVIYSNLISLSYETIIKLKILSKIFISYGIFSIGLQSGRLDLRDIKLKPFMVATSVWIIVIPIAYLISIN
ncbi:putative sulfate exporter family transporter [Gammaproteobacteria bacterium]|nr:putative sulfate exporter family transporter [Gammaproteobacteria bacterium]